MPAHYERGTVLRKETTKRPTPGPGIGAASAAPSDEGGHMRRIITAGLVGIIAAAGLGATALATGNERSEPAVDHHVGVTIEPLAHASIAEKVRAGGDGISLKTDGPKDLLTARITLEPGGSFGWHSHPGPVLVAVTKGTFTLYQVENGRCKKRKFGPGDAFVESGRRVHLGQNEGTGNVRIFATFLARAGTTKFTRGEDPPEQCR
jgi:quercetin dioxygenase-like cupin family protein